MAFTAEFFLFSKKRNSTKQPTLGSGTTFTGIELKDDCSILNPIIKIRVAGMPVVTVAPVNTFTYCYIAKFNRYYFIEDWIYSAGMWEGHLSIDVLASHKTEIGSTSAYVERSASSYNGTIIDKLYPANTDYDIQTAALDVPWYQIAMSGGTFVVGIINAAANTMGAITYYAMTTAQLGYVLAYMFGNDIWTASGITEISEGLFKSMFNPFQYIISCMWFPFQPTIFGSNQEQVYLGYYSTGTYAYKMTTVAIKRFITGTVPAHPQASSRGSFLNYGPYTDVTLYIPVFGSVPIDTAFLNKGLYLYCPVWIDPVTGECTIRVSCCPSSTNVSEDNVCAERSGKIGVPIQLAQVMADYSHTIQTMQSGLSGGIAGIIAGAIGTTVQSALDAKYPSVSTSGTNGSFITQVMNGLIVAKHSKIVDADNTDLGRPLMTTKTLNTLSGYIKCGEAHFASPCLASERAKVEEFMLSGFYYE